VAETSPANTPLQRLWTDNKSLVVTKPAQNEGSLQWRTARGQNGPTLESLRDSKLRKSQQQYSMDGGKAGWGWVLPHANAHGKYSSANAVLLERMTEIQLQFGGQPTLKDHGGAFLDLLSERMMGRLVIRKLDILAISIHDTPSEEGCHFVIATRQRFSYRLVMDSISSAFDLLSDLNKAIGNAPPREPYTAPVRRIPFRKSTEAKKGVDALNEDD
jgi:hypothetical protein